MTRAFRIFIIIFGILVTYYVIMEYIYPNTNYCRNATEKIKNWEYTEANYQCGGNVRLRGCITEREKLLNKTQSCKYGAEYLLMKFMVTGRGH